MKVLLTGAEGQLGRHLQTLAPASIELITSARRSGDEPCDLADPGQVERLLDRVAPGLIINAAAWTAVDDAEDHPGQAHCLNAELPGRLATWCSRHNRALISYSTDYVFDGQPGRGWREDDPPAPASVYGRSKLEGERQIMASGARALVLRTAWVYSALGGNFLSAIMRRAQAGQDLRVVADQTGSPTWAGDLARASWHLVGARLDDLAEPQLLHVAGASPVSWYELARAAVTQAAAAGLIEGAVSIDPISSAEWPQKAHRPAWSVLDCRRYESLTGEKMMTLETALDACLEQWKNAQC